MNDNFEKLNDGLDPQQKEKLLSLSHEINLLRQQVNYLLRNEKALGLLDLDVLMNRTHAIYDLLCSINLGENGDDQDIELDPEAVAGLFGVSLQDEEQPEPTVETQTEEQAVVEEQVETKPDFQEPIENQEETPVFEEEIPAVVPESLPVEETPEPEVTQEQETEMEQPIEETTQPIENEHFESEEKPEEKTDEAPKGDEFGFFFRFEDTPSTEQQETAEEAQEPVLVDDKLVHFVNEIPEAEIPERDLVEGENLVQDNPFEMPKMENEDAEFELSTPETLGERMIREDHSLAAKFQQNPVRDLKSVIGINDKFLFVNELFGGSMEKYNKSIENLNDLKTLNGALIYLNELKIELQWNSSNEAYRKLSELVRRKFE